jgi:hypothetical protein
VPVSGVEGGELQGADRLEESRAAEDGAAGHLGLDPRLHQAGERQRRLGLRRETHGVREHVRPHRLVHAVAVPDRPVGEADLAPDRLPALRAAAALDLGEHLVGRRHVEARVLRGDRRER